MDKKYLIPVVVGVVLMAGIIFTVVYKKVDGDVGKPTVEIETIAPKETEPIESKVSTEKGSLEDFEVNQTRELPKSIIVDKDGSVMSEEEVKAHEESMANSMKLELVTNDDGSESIVDINGNEIGVEVEENEEKASETLSGQDMEDMQNGIEDYTYKQSYERIREFVKIQVKAQRDSGNTEFTDITDEYIDSASYEELDSLYSKVMGAVGWER